MLRSTALTAAALITSAVLLSGYAGGGRVKSGPAIVPYLCDGGRQASAIYQHGGDYQHAKVMLTFDGSSPLNPNASRSSRLKHEPLLYIE